MNIILIAANRRVDLKIAPGFIYLIIIFSVVILAGFIYNIVHFAAKGVDQTRLPKLKKENIIVRDELKKMKQEFIEINKILDSLKIYDKRLRTFASLGPISDELRDMGIGGQGLKLDTSKNVTGSDRDLVRLSENLDNLLARSRLQKKSLAEIYDKLNEKNYLRNRTPSIVPVQGWFLSGFGYRVDPFTGIVKLHEGLDIVAPMGTPIVATADGVIKFAGNFDGFGLTVEIDHGYGFITRYAHCQRIKSAVGMEVRRGDIIAYVGSTGRSTGPHLHYEVRISGNPVNPLDYILISPVVID